MLKKRKTAMTSVTFRSLSVDEVIKTVKNSGLDGIEWGGDVHVPAGNYELAKEVGNKTRAEGLEVVSYGSYYTVGKNENYIFEFEKVLQTALALGTKTIRIWNYHKASSLCSSEEFESAVAELKAICNIADKRGVVVAMEFHGSSLNDCATATKRVLQAVRVENLKTYWQPLFDFEQNIKDIKTLKDYILNVHVYKWVFGEEIERKLLSSANQEWAKYVELIDDGVFIIEFTKDDDVDNFIKDAKTLRSLV